MLNNIITSDNFNLLYDSYLLTDNDRRYLRRPDRNNDLFGSIIELLYILTEKALIDGGLKVGHNDDDDVFVDSDVYERWAKAVIIGKLGMTESITRILNDYLQTIPYRLCYTLTNRAGDLEAQLNCIITKDCAYVLAS